MPFTLTHEYLDSLLDPAQDGHMEQLLAAMEPDCVWRWGASEQAGAGGTGVYNPASFKEKMAPIMQQVFGQNGVKFDFFSRDVSPVCVRADSQLLTDSGFWTDHREQGLRAGFG